MKISKQQRLMMIGAMALCKHHYNKMRELEELVCDFVGEDKEDYVRDSIYAYEEFDFDIIIQKASISVEDEQTR